MKYLALLTLCFLIGCAPDTRYDETKIFRYNDYAGINSLDPAFARTQSNIWATNQIFNGLVQMDRQLNITPCLAKSWRISEDGKTYRFTLRNDVYFHKNECFKDSTRKLVAQDVIYSFNRLRSKKLAAPGSWVFSKLDTLYALNDTVLELKLKEAFTPFLGILSMKYCSVLPQEAVTYYGDDFRANPVGTGPFYKKLWVENEKLVLRRNPNYFEEDSAGKSLPYLESVAISFIPDKQSAFMEFVKGKLDFISGIDASYKDEILTYEGELQKQYEEDFMLYKQPYLNTEYLGILVDEEAETMKGNPLLDKRIRQAINYGFDRVKMMRYLRNNIGSPATYGIIPSGLPAFDTSVVNGYTYQPEKVKKLLAEAGYPNGNGLPEITVQTSAEYLDLCEYIQSEVSQLGIPLKVEVTPPSTLRQSMATAKAAFFRASWIADYPDAENYLSLFYSPNKAPNGPNYTHFKNADFDAWYQKAGSTTNDSMRLNLYAKMDSLVIEEAPIVPLYYDQVLRFYPKNVKGLQGNALNLLDLKQVWKE